MVYKPYQRLSAYRQLVSDAVIAELSLGVPLTAVALAGRVGVRCTNHFRRLLWGMVAEGVVQAYWLPGETRTMWHFMIVGQGAEATGDVALPH